MTLLTHPIPSTVGIVTGSIRAASDAAYRELIGRFVEFYPRNLDNWHWGESVAFGPANEFGFRLAFLDMPESEVAPSSSGSPISSETDPMNTVLNRGCSSWSSGTSGIRTTGSVRILTSSPGIRGRARPVTSSGGQATRANWALLERLPIPLDRNRFDASRSK